MNSAEGSETLNSRGREQRAARILMVDDDERLQAVVREFLQNYGFEVFSLGSGAGLNEKVAELAPDLLLLDVMLPGDDGFTLLRKLREKSRLPVIMLTACGDDTDRIIGLEIGADDYLPKPYNPRELLARVKAVLRRAPIQQEADYEREADPSGNPGRPAAGQLRSGPYLLDPKLQSLSLDLGQGGKSAELSSTEYRIVHAFMSHAGQVLSREKVLALAFGEDHYVCDRNIDVYISRLRAILRNLGETGTRIRTVWGAGYTWMKEY